MESTDSKINFIVEIYLRPIRFPTRLEIDVKLATANRIRGTAPPKRHYSSTPTAKYPDINPIMLWVYELSGYLAGRLLAHRVGVANRLVAHQTW